MVNFKNTFQRHGIFQIRFSDGGRDAFYKIRFFCVDHADNNVGVSNVDS